MNQAERKLQIYKIRINTLLEEHADVLAQAQELHERLKESEQKIQKLEAQLRERNVQEEAPRHTITHVDSTEN